TFEGGASDEGTVFRMTPSGDLTTLLSFNVNIGRFPLGNLIEASDGNLYGTTRGGGPSLAGTVFRITRAGKLTVLHFFNGRNGQWPDAGLVEGRDGVFYGA